MTEFCTICPNWTWRRDWKHGRLTYLTWYIIAGVSNTGRGLQRVLELDSEHFQPITVVEYLGDVELRYQDSGVALLLHNELQTDFLQVLGSLAVLEIVNDRAKHRI